MEKGWNPFRRRCILRIPFPVNDGLTAVLQPGDVVLYRARAGQLLGGLITTFTESPYSHAEVYVGDGWCVDASAYGVTLSKGMHEDLVDVFRLKGGLTAEQRRVVVDKAFQSLARPYDYFLLFTFPFLTRAMAARRAANGAFICSENVAWCYAEAGVDLSGKGDPTTLEAPADLGRSGRLEWLGFWNGAAPVPDGKPNERHPLQGRPNVISQLVIWLFADPLSCRDEYYRQLTASRERTRRWPARPA
jgi:hypothetical protein